jgi:FHA domain
MVSYLGRLNSYQENVAYHDRCDHLSMNKLDKLTTSRFELDYPFTYSCSQFSYYSLDRNSKVPSIICSACGHKNYSGEMFCQKCGVQLGPVMSVPPPPPQLQRNDQPNLSQSKQSIGRLILQIDNTEIELKTDEGMCVLGRSDPVIDLYPEVDLTAFGAEKKGVSRRHAKILKTSEGIFIEDLNSTNFTFLNDLRLEPEMQYPLREGDEIRLGYFVMLYRSI